VEFLKQLSSVHWIGIVLALAAPLFLESGYLMHILIDTGFFIILVTGLNIIIGYVGALSLGQQAFLGIGAYTSALLMKQLQFSYLPCLIGSGLLSGIAGLFIGAICLRLRSHYFVIVTLAFALIMELICINWVDLTGGPMGMPGVPSPTFYIPGLLTFTVHSKLQYYYLVLAMVFVGLYVKYRLVYSRIGRAFVAIRENEELAKSMGINTYGYSLLAFVISSIYAGVAGSFQAHYLNLVTPDMFGFYSMISMLLMIAIGGKGTIGGPILGAIIISALPEFLRMADMFRLPIFGFLLVVATIYLPDGIIHKFVPISNAIESWKSRLWRILSLKS
jgi:branched-chain amino acid transport system permease protein